MGIEKQVFSVRLDAKLIMYLKELAAEQNRNASNLVETILKDYVKTYESKTNDTK